MLEFAVLGLLHEDPLHGYELRRQLSAQLGAFRTLSYGSLYPALQRLEARPIATMTLEAQEKHERKERVHRDD